MTAPMKLAAKLPDTPTVNALAKALSERPLKSRLLVIEVDAPRLQLDVDPLDGDEVRTPIATIQSLAWITDADDCTDVRMAARRAWDSHTPQPELPATEQAVRDFRDSIASTLNVGESRTVSAGGQSATIHGERIDPDTGEVLE